MLMAILMALQAPVKEVVSPTTIRIIAGIIFVILVTIIIARRKRMASKRKPTP